MNSIDVDKLMRAYSHILSFRDNLSNYPDTDVVETYVTEYHKRLETLKDIGLEIEEFKIPQNIVSRRPLLRVAGDPPDSRWSSERYVERTFFMVKLDAVLNYLRLLLQEVPREIGFRQVRN